MTRIVILGRDAPLWLSASVLHAALRPAGVTVTAIELPSKLYPSDVYATLPGIEALHGRLGLDERDLLRGTRGAYSLGQNFVDMLGGTPAFLNAYGGYGAPVDEQDFFGYWVKARDAGMPAGFADFSLTAAAARQGRVMIPDEASEAYGRADYGYHLPAIAYTGGLKSVATRVGVGAVAANHILVDRDEAGAITALVADGQRVEGDLFIDATGDDAALIGVTLGVALESWRDWFPVDRVFSARGPAFDPIPTYAELRAWHGGWTALYPGQATTHIVHAFASTQISDEDALRGAGSASGLPLSDAVLRPANPGRRTDIWAHNCVAIGGAACALDPVHNLDLHAAQIGLVALLTHFPASADIAPNRAEYHRVMRGSFDRLRDYQAAFYTLAPYAGLFWHAGRDAAPPATLAHIIATFRARGELPPMEDDSIPFDHWRALLTGLGVVPESWAPRIDTTDDAEVAAQFRRMLGFVKDTVARQPTHAQALEHG